MGLKLYLITDSPAYDVTYDRTLLVVAASPDEAINHWRAYYEEDSETPERVFEVDTSALELRPGPVEWHTERLKQVGGWLAIP